MLYLEGFEVDWWMKGGRDFVGRVGGAGEVLMVG